MNSKDRELVSLHSMALASVVYVGLATLSLAATASASEVSVSVGGVRNDRGHVLVALCPRADFLGLRCPYFGTTPARPGFVIVTLSGVPPGQYAVQAFHDENDNLEIDRNLLGIPTEDIGFGNDAPMKFGPPRFEDAAVVVSGRGLRTTLRLRSVGL